MVVGQGPMRTRLLLHDADIDKQKLSATVLFSVVKPQPHPQH